MRDFEDFLPEVLPYAVACPEPVAVHHLRRAAQEFCTRTKLWRETDGIPTSGGDFELICVPPNAALVLIESISLDGFGLTPLRSDTPLESGEDGEGTSVYFTQRGTDQLQLIPSGVAGRNMRVSMILKPAEGADMAPDFLFDHHARAIGDGALAGVLMLPDQPYSDPARAAFFGSRFRASMDSLFGASSRGQQRANVRTRPRFF